MSEERPSKSARKREAQAIRAMVDELVALKPPQLTALISETEVRDAIVDAQAMTSHGAARRQKQYVARLLRERDVASLRDGLDKLAGDPAREKRRFKAAEQLRDRLLTAEPREREQWLDTPQLARDEALNAALQQYDQARNERERKAAAKAVFRRAHALQP
ncbi:MAG: ribosome biogenesis factor YjgA [Pseudomonadota bacterium]